MSRNSPVEAGGRERGADAVLVAHRPALPGRGIEEEDVSDETDSKAAYNAGRAPLPGDHVAILKVAKLGSPILRKRASEIEAHDLKKGRFRAFFEDMMETMVEYHGTGLAAPQVSTGLRIVLYEVHGEKRGKDVLEVPPTLLVNPSFEVLDATEEEDFEACLSVPFLAAKVPRPKKIRVSALDTSGKPVSVRRGGLPRARRPPRERPPRRRRVPRPRARPGVDPVHGGFLSSCRAARPLTTEEKRQLMLLKFRPVCICNTIRGPRVKEAIDRGARTVEDVARGDGLHDGRVRGRALPPRHRGDARGGSGEGCRCPRRAS